jgi:pimeloyl-ACP methyl ester carboxylesterase
MWIKYPVGRVVMPETTPSNHSAPANVDSPAGMSRAINVRVQDLSFVLDQLLTNTSFFAQHIPNFPSLIDHAQAWIGVLGHSLGGASSAMAMLHDRRLVCGIALDGKITESVVDQELDRTFLIIGAEGHTRANVTGWSDFWSNLRSFRRHLIIKGSTHTLVSR